MADPDFDNVAEQIAFRIDVFDEFEKDTNGVSGYVAIEEAALNDIEGVLAQPARNSLIVDRQQLAAVLSQENIRNALVPYLRQMAVAINSPDANTNAGVESIWEDLYDYMAATPETVLSRQFTYGAPSAGGSNTGNGSLIRLTVDEEGFDLEGWWPDVYTATCIRDARQTGSSGDEVWQIEGTDAALDELKRTGSGLVKKDVQIKALTGRDAVRYLRNPSFNLYTGDDPAVGSPDSPTAISGWTTTSGNFTNVLIDLDTVYRATTGDPANASIRFNGNDGISQDLVAQGIQLDFEVPYVVRVRVYRRASCDGTLTIALGAVSRAVTMSTLTDDAWNNVDLVATPGANNWPANFNQNALTFSLTLASRTTGSCNADDITIHPFTRIGRGNDQRRGRGSMGTYVAFVGGSTPWTKGDTFTMTDTEVGAVNQEHFARAHLGYLPHADSSPSWADK